MKNLKGSNVEIKGKDNKNIFDILRENKKILTKYKGEFYFILENTKQHIFFDNGNCEYDNTTSNTNLSSIYQVKHIRNLSSLYNGIKNNEVVFQTDDSNGANCCEIF